MVAHVMRGPCDFGGARNLAVEPWRLVPILFPPAAGDPGLCTGEKEKCSEAHDEQSQKASEQWTAQGHWVRPHWLQRAQRNERLMKDLDATKISEAHPMTCCQGCSAAGSTVVTRLEWDQTGRETPDSTPQRLLQNHLGHREAGICPSHLPATSVRTVTSKYILWKQ